MKTSLKRPCKNCPFRTDTTIVLRPGRAREIATALLSDQSFGCHETTGSDGEGELRIGEDTQFCAGAMILCEKNEGRIPQFLRIAERLGLYRKEQLDMASPVVESFPDFVAMHRLKWTLSNMVQAMNREPEQQGNREPGGKQR